MTKSEPTCDRCGAHETYCQGNRFYLICYKCAKELGYA